MDSILLAGIMLVVGQLVGYLGLFLWIDRGHRVLGGGCLFITAVCMIRYVVVVFVETAR